ALNRALRPEAPVDVPCYYGFDHDGTHLVALDSHEVGHADGVLDAAQLAWLERDLSAHRDRPTIVFVHHHPWPLGHAWMDTMPLRNGAELMDILARHAHVSWLIGGHVHSEQVIQRGALTVLTTPSTCIQLAKATASAGRPASWQRAPASRPRRPAATPPSSAPAASCASSSRGGGATTAWRAPKSATRSRRWPWWPPRCRAGPSPTGTTASPGG